MEAQPVAQHRVVANSVDRRDHHVGSQHPVALQVHRRHRLRPPPPLASVHHHLVVQQALVLSGGGQRHRRDAGQVLAQAQPQLAGQRRAEREHDGGDGPLAKVRLHDVDGQREVRVGVVVPVLGEDGGEGRRQRESQRAARTHTHTHTHTPRRHTYAATASTPHSICAIADMMRPTRVISMQCSCGSTHSSAACSTAPSPTRNGSRMSMACEYTVGATYCAGAPPAPAPIPTPPAAAPGAWLPGSSPPSGSTASVSPCRVRMSMTQWRKIMSVDSVCSLNHTMPHRDTVASVAYLWRARARRKTAGRHQRVVSTRPTTRKRRQRPRPHERTRRDTQPPRAALPRDTCTGSVLEALDLEHDADVGGDGKALARRQRQQPVVVEHAVQVLGPFRVHITVEHDPLPPRRLATHVVQHLAQHTREHAVRPLQRRAVQHAVPGTNNAATCPTPGHTPHQGRCRTTATTAEATRYAAACVGVRTAPPWTETWGR